MVISLLGNVAWETKNFLRFTKINLGDEHLREESSDPHTLVDRQAEALRNAVDVVERLRDPNHKSSLDPITN